MHDGIDLNAALPETTAGQAPVGAQTVPGKPPLDDIDRRLLNEFQRDFPLMPTPYADIARRLGISEQAVIERLRALQTTGTVSRIGPVFQPNRIGISTLAAMVVPPERLDAVAALVSAYTEVNHNYEREHDYNLWFVAAAADEAQLAAVLADIAQRTGIEVLSLPMLEDYHIDLGFDLRWA